MVWVLEFITSLIVFFSPTQHTAGDGDNNTNTAAAQNAMDIGSKDRTAAVQHTINTANSGDIVPHHIRTKLQWVMWMKTIKPSVRSKVKKIMEISTGPQLIQSKMKVVIEMMRGAVAGGVGPGFVIAFGVSPYISLFRFRSTAVKGDRMSQLFRLQHTTFIPPSMTIHAGRTLFSRSDSGQTGPIVIITLYIYIIYNPNLGLRIAVLGREREQGSFRGSIEGVGGSTEGARGSTEGARGSTEGVRGSTEGARGSTEGAKGTTMGQWRGAADGSLKWIPWPSA